MDKIEFGNRIRDVRSKMGLSQMEFGLLCEMPAGHIAQIEKGIRNVTLGTIDKISKGVGVSISDLLREDMPVFGELNACANRFLAHFKATSPQLQEIAVEMISMFRKADE
jgi:transcriptional regulator with XRE-family HTH domain